MALQQALGLAEREMAFAHQVLIRFLPLFADNFTPSSSAISARDLSPNLPPSERLDLENGVRTRSAWLIQLRPYFSHTHHESLTLAQEPRVPPPVWPRSRPRYALHLLRYQFGSRRAFPLNLLLS